MKFKPMLSATVDNLDEIRYPKYVSLKLDGIRCIFHPEMGMVSRSLKAIPNKQLREKFEVLARTSFETGILWDGELYSHNLTFQEITRAVMTQDFNDPNTRKKIAKDINGDAINVQNYIDNLLSSIKFYCFDTLDPNNPTKPLRDRINFFVPKGTEITFVSQNLMNSKEEVDEFFKTALQMNYEGLILRCPDSPYKFGRSTLKEEWMLKIKPFLSFDANIIGVQQATEVDPDAEKKTNELGYSETSRKKDDRVLIDKASAFIVLYEGQELKVTLAMTDDEKKEVWQNREQYIGRMIEYKAMLVGAKDLPRHPIFLRFREDRD